MFEEKRVLTEEERIMNARRYSAKCARRRARRDKAITNIITEIVDMVLPFSAGCFAMALFLNAWF